MNRKRISSDYDRRLGADGKETYIYTGPRFNVDLPAKRLLRYRVICWLMPVLGFLIFIGSGISDPQGLRQMYIVLPFIALFMPLALLIGDAYKVTTANKNMERKEYARSIVQMRRCSVAVVALSGIVFIAQAAFMIFGLDVVSVKEYYLLIGTFILACLFFVFYRWQKRIPVTSDR